MQRKPPRYLPSQTLHVVVLEDDRIDMEIILHQSTQILALPISRPVPDPVTKH